MSSAAEAAQFWVTTQADSGPGSLRQAIVDMNAAAGESHQIGFDLANPGAIVLASDLPTIRKPTVTITGFKSPHPVIIDGDGAYRLIAAFNGTTNHTMRLSWLELRNGNNPNSSSGGTCLTAGVPNGGQVGVLSLWGMTFRNCVGEAEFDNQMGGAMVAAQRNVTIDHSLFESNRVEGSGGAMLVVGYNDKVIAVEINETSFIGNIAEGTASQRGSAIRAISALLDIRASRFIDNRVHYTGVDSGILGTGSGIYAADSTVWIEGSLFFGNWADASTVQVVGTDGLAPIEIGNTLFVGNTVGLGSNLSLQHYRAHVRNVSMLGTHTDNYFRPTAIYHSYSGTSVAAGLMVSNSILAASNAANDRVCGVGTTGFTLYADYNLVAGPMNPGCDLSLNADLDALAIEALRDNGGPVETVSLFAASQALDAGHPDSPLVADSRTCRPVDARDVDRPQPASAGATARCDIGAWESEGEPPLFRHDFEEVLWRP